MHFRDVIWKIKSKSNFPVSFSLINAEMNLVGNYRTLGGLRTFNLEGLSSTMVHIDNNYVSFWVPCPPGRVSHSRLTALTASNDKMYKNHFVSRTSHFLKLKKDTVFERPLWINMKQYRFSPQLRMPFQLSFALTKVCCCHRSISCHYTVDLIQFNEPQKHPRNVHVMMLMFAIWPVTTDIINEIRFVRLPWPTCQHTINLGIMENGVITAIIMNAYIQRYLLSLPSSLFTPAINPPKPEIIPWTLGPHTPAECPCGQLPQWQRPENFVLVLQLQRQRTVFLIISVFRIISILEWVVTKLKSVQMYCSREYNELC